LDQLTTIAFFAENTIKTNLGEEQLNSSRYEKNTDRRYCRVYWSFVKKLEESIIVQTGSKTSI
jgi:hypothetical protein